MTAHLKGKLERWHRTFRDHFLAELEVSRLHDLDALNARVWAWIEQVYHRRPHGGLEGITPLERYQQDLPNIRLLGQKAARLDALFHHRVARKVRRDGTVSYQGKDFEVPYELSGKAVQLVVDPHGETVVGVEDVAGKALGPATPLDATANARRRRRRPDPDGAADLAGPSGPGGDSPNGIELAYRQYHGQPEPEGR
ncbi:MAG: integrase core domain-containing protein [Nitrospiraceae bacterium]